MDRLPRACPIRQPGAERAEAQRHDRTVDEQDRDARRAGFEAHAGDEADRDVEGRLNQPEDDRAGKQREICDAADAVDEGDGVVVVTDMFGGSPSNLSLRACGPTNRRILYGANLPMLIKLAKSRRKTVPDAVAVAMEAGRKYIDSQVVGEDLGRAVGT